MEIDTEMTSNPMEYDDQMEVFQDLKIGSRVLVNGSHAGTIRYIPSNYLENDDAIIGVELDRNVGDSNGIYEGIEYFKCSNNRGKFVKKQHVKHFSKQDMAASHIQSMWRCYRAVRRFEALLHGATWNILDNHQEQLNLKRAEKIKSAEQALAMLAKQKDPLPVGHIDDQIHSDYTGPKVFWPLKLQNVLDVLEQFKKGVILHHKYVLEILKYSKKLMNASPTLQEIDVNGNEKITIVGDIHGQLQDLYSIFTINGLPSEKNKYLFNGDFVDRGRYGSEVVLSMLLFKILFPTGVYMNRGNHESRNQTSWMGFEEELYEKYDGSMQADPTRASRVFNAFLSVFDCLPLCSLVQKKIFVVHGGLFSRDGVTLQHLKAISRKREPPLHQQGFEDQVYEDLLWSDPRSIQGRQPSERGAGTEFGQDVTNNFCAINRVALVVRSHECVPEGFDVLHGGRLITLFSASRYCGTQMNKGAFLTLGTDLQPEIQQFYAHPMNQSEFNVQEIEVRDNIKEDILRMIVERICDHKTSLYWYFTQNDKTKSGKTSRLMWSEALRSVLQLDIPFLTYQQSLVNLEPDGLINYSKFLSRYRIENTLVDSTGWQEGVISNICKKLYKAMGAGSMEQAFSVFDTDANGYIDYEEFMTTLKQLDTGLSEIQVFELMRTADTNDDGRIDFREFAQRFEVIFTDIHAVSRSMSSATSIHSPMGTITDHNMLPPTPSGSGSRFAQPHKLGRRISDREREALNPVPAPDVNPSTMLSLQSIGKVMFQREDTLFDLFHKFDVNRDGVLQRDEFFGALKTLGFDFDSEQLEKIMAAVDADGGETIDYKEFVAAFGVQDTAEAMEIEKGHMTWQQSVLQQVSNVFYQHRIHIRSAFRMFDRDNSGTISKEEFRAGINTFNSLLNSPLTMDQIEELLEHLDKNKDGVLCYKEFFEGFRVVDVRITQD